MTITEKIKNFDDVLQYHKITAKEFEKQCKGLSDDEIAYRQVKLICSVLNEDWTPDWHNGKWDKWYPYFWMESSSSGRFSFAGSVDPGSRSSVGSRLCYKTEELSDYAATTFIDVYKRFLTL
jgi:hypothetical protein